MLFKKAGVLMRQLLYSPRTFTSTIPTLTCLQVLIAHGLARQLDVIVPPSTLDHSAAMPQQLFRKPWNYGEKGFSSVDYHLKESSRENTYYKDHPMANRLGHDLKTHRPVASWVDAIKNADAGKLSSSKSFASFDFSDADSSAGWQASCTDITTRPIPVKRTLLLQNLADEVTYKDVVGALRGGALLEVSLQSVQGSGTKMAWVSFVDPVAALSFLKYAQSEAIRLRGQTVTFYVRTH